MVGEIPRDFVRKTEPEPVSEIEANGRTSAAGGGHAEPPLLPAELAEEHFLAAKEPAFAEQ